LIPRIFSARPETVQRHRHVEGFDGLSHARVTAHADRPFPLQVDGDYIGEFNQVDYAVSPGALLAVA